MWIQAYRSGDNSTTPSADQVSSELASLGNDPVVMVTKSTATYRIPVSWRPVSEDSVPKCVNVVSVYFVA